MNLLETCEDCYSFQLSEYPATIYVNGNLAPRTIYWLKITDSFGNSYAVEITTDINGNFSLSGTGAWPLTFFNRNASAFKFEVSLELQPFVSVDFAFDASDYSPFYSCILVEFVADNSPVNIIQ